MPSSTSCQSGSVSDIEDLVTPEPIDSAMLTNYRYSQNASAAGGLSSMTSFNGRNGLSAMVDSSSEFERSGNKSFVMPNGLKKSKRLDDLLLKEEIESIKTNKQTNIPGIACIWIKTWGCTHNSSDSEYMAGQLAAYGYNIVCKNECK